VKWVWLSAFSNAGQRCAAGSRIIVFAKVYDTFRHKLVSAAKAHRVGPNDGDDFGPVINERQLTTMLAAIGKAKQEGARVLTGGARLTGNGPAKGFYLAQTLIESASPAADISRHELFDPIACLHRVGGYDEAIVLGNDSPYGVTACIHTQSVDRGIDFSPKIRSGGAGINAGTFGSEPHMPLGGWRQAGTGSREPGTEALDVY